jgi:hypothetical protein
MIDSIAHDPIDNTSMAMLAPRILHNAPLNQHRRIGSSIKQCCCHYYYMGIQQQCINLSFDTHVAVLRHTAAIAGGNGTLQTCGRLAAEHQPLQLHDH